MQPSRWRLIRDILALQVKLVVDGIRDLLLVPVSLIAGVISLTRPGDEPGTEFYSLMKLGRKSDHWINLFSAADRLDPGNGTTQKNDIDDMVNKLENFVINEYRSGEVTRQAKEHFDQLLASLNKKKPGDKYPPEH